LQSTQGEKEVHRRKAEELMAALAAAQKTHQHNQQELASIKKRVERALRNEGPVWTERVLSSAPAFKPLDGDGFC
jgi:pantothenate synthetase